MRRNENQPRPTAGCLSVPLFNQKKRCRLPLTSNPSENVFSSDKQCTDMQNTGYLQAQPSHYRTQPSQRDQWSTQPGWSPQQSNSRPAVPLGAAGSGYAPMPQPHKPIYNWSQTGQQRTPGCRDSMATTGPWQGSYPSNSGIPPTHSKPQSGFQPMNQLSFKTQTHSPWGSFQPQQPNPPQPCSQTTQRKFKPTGHPRQCDTPQSPAHNQTNPQHQKVPELQAKPVNEKTLRILTAVIEGMRHWSQYKDKVPLLFEIFATLDSAVTAGNHGAKSFLMRDGKDVVQCVYYENDQLLPRLTRGLVHRCVGNYDRQKDVLTCVTVRAASPSEQRNAQEAVRVSDGEMRRVVQVLVEM